ncbi:MAG TPA: hypothetical protein VFQ65_18945 [Kofleriaceae bacterium]|nr:hypothetical protein [Kofleriaceae bacterium]
MRLLSVTLPAAVVLLTAGSARADSFLEVAGGLSIPVGDHAWTNIADTSPKLGARVGGVNDHGLGGMIQADWTPVNLNNNGGAFGVGSLDVAGHEFRFLGDFTVHHPILPKLLLSGRVGAGIDIAHESVTLTVLGNTTSSSDTNIGFAFEFGGGLWYQLGDIELGGELALPISTHSKNGNGTDGNYSFNYTSYNIDLLFGVRVLSR